MEELSEIIKLAIAALKANRMRSFLTMLGVVIGVASVILLVSIGSGLQSYITGQLEQLGAKTLMVTPGSSFEFGSQGGQGGGVPGAGMMASKFTITHVKELGKAESVSRVMPYTENNGTLRYGKNTHITQVAGVGYEYPNIRNHGIEDGRFFSKAEEESAKKVVVLGKTVVEKLFGGENPINKKITISDGRFTVIGVLESMGAFGGVDIDDQAFIPATTALRQFDMEYFMTIFVEAKSQENIEETKTEVKKILLKYLEDDEFSVIDTKNLLNTISSILGVLTIALGGIAAISLVVGGIGIANIMLVSVTERTREIGLRKAVGANPQIIMIQFLTEAVILSVAGGTIGIILGSLGSFALGKVAPTIVTAWSVIIAFLVATAVGIIFGLAPAVRASRLTPVDALRYE